MFTNTLPGPYYDKMIGSVSTGFSDLVKIGERIENGLKNGKIQITSGGQDAAKRHPGGFQKKKEGETNAVMSGKGGSSQAPSVQVPYRQQPQRNQYQNQNRNARTRGQYDPITMTYTELYPYLVQQGAITTRPLTPPDPLPPGFRSDLHCEFHQGAAGHDLENCFALKARVQELIKGDILSFKDVPPNVVNNPSPEQGK